MAMPTFTMRQLLEAGVHFGHNTRRWNPKMKPYIFGDRNGVHIMDLQQTVPMLHEALQIVRDTVASGGRVLFVGTKRQAADVVAETAQACGQYYVNHRWLGGTLTNWRTITESIKRMKNIEKMLGDENIHIQKRERLSMEREHAKLEIALGGIRDMGGTPEVIVVIDTNKEALAVKEANRLGIPVVAILDSNCDPEGISYAVPGNDDASRAIQFYCGLFEAAVLDGIQTEMAKSGMAVGTSENPGAEPALAEASEKEAPAAETSANQTGEEPVAEKKAEKVASASA